MRFNGRMECRRLFPVCQELLRVGCEAELQVNAGGMAATELASVGTRVARLQRRRGGAILGRWGTMGGAARTVGSVGRAYSHAERAAGNVQVGDGR